MFTYWHSWNFSYYFFVFFVFHSWFLYIFLGILVWLYCYGPNHLNLSWNVTSIRIMAALTDCKIIYLKLTIRMLFHETHRFLFLLYLAISNYRSPAPSNNRTSQIKWFTVNLLWTRERGLAIVNWQCILQNNWFMLFAVHHRGMMHFFGEFVLAASWASFIFFRALKTSWKQYISIMQALKDELI